MKRSGYDPNLCGVCWAANCFGCPVPWGNDDESEEETDEAEEDGGTALCREAL